MASPRHVCNLFELKLKDGLPQLVPWTVPSSSREEVKLYKDAIAFELGRALQSSALPSGGGFVSAMLERLPSEVPIGVEGRNFRLVRGQPEDVILSSRRQREIVRRLISADLKRYLVYGQRLCWYRASAFFPHDFSGTLWKGFYIIGMEVDFVAIGARLFVAVDRKLTPVGPALDSREYKSWQGFVRIDPYARQGSGDEEDEGNVLSSFSRADVVSEKRRNYIIRLDERFQRMYVDVEATMNAGDGIIIVEPLHDAPDDRKREVARADVYPILAPNEIRRYLGWQWEKARSAFPDQRMREAISFVNYALFGIQLLGREAEVSGEPLALGAAEKVLPWPTLSVGKGSRGVPVETRLPDPDHRLKALAQRGFRDYPAHWDRLEIVPAQGRINEAQQLREACEAWLAKWRLPLKVTLCPVAVAESVDPQGLAEVFNHYERSSDRPALLLVFMPSERNSSTSSDSLYQSIHRRLGRELHMHVKPVSGWGSKSADAYALNCLGSLLARGGAIPYGLARTGDSHGLTHDFVVGVDIGGKDRASRDVRTQYLSVLAMAGDDQPVLWRPEHPDDLAFSGEQLTEELVRRVVLEPARDVRLRGRYQRGWLYLRDGRVFPEELKALRKVVEEAKEERLLGQNTSFMVVEVHKNHALRMFMDLGEPRERSISGEQDVRWGQPSAGTVWWLSKAEFDQDLQCFVSEALISTTGEPWELVSSADPLRCLFYSLNGPAQSDEAARDIWHLSHMNWRALASGTALPMPLHAAQEMVKELNDRGGLVGWPF